MIESKKISPIDWSKVINKIKNGEVKVGEKSQTKNKAGGFQAIKGHNSEKHKGKDKNEIEPRPVEEGVPESVIQAEGKAHHEDAAKADRKIKLPEKTYEALEKKAKAEGKTPDEKAAEIIVEKAKAKPEKTEVFPADAKINDYCFLGFKKSWLEDLGWKKGMALKIEKNADGSITLRKA